jgi:hypothetical protein
MNSLIEYLSPLCSSFMDHHQIVSIDPSIFVDLYSSGSFLKRYTFVMCVLWGV